jgi:hypothetical protein
MLLSLVSALKYISEEEDETEKGREIRQEEVDENVVGKLDGKATNGHESEKSPYPRRRIPAVMT